MSENTQIGLQSDTNWNPILGQTEADSVNTTLGQLEPLMPFLIGLTPAERRKLVRAGLLTRPFIADALTTAEANPGLVPRSVDIEDLRARADSLERLREVRRRLSALSERVNDTEALLASRLYGVARTVYAIMKTPASLPGLGERRRQLQKRFKRRKKQNSPDELPAAV